MLRRALSLSRCWQRAGTPCDLLRSVQPHSLLCLCAEARPACRTISSTSTQTVTLRDSAAASAAAPGPASSSPPPTAPPPPPRRAWQRPAVAVAALALSACIGAVVLYRRRSGGKPTSATEVGANSQPGSGRPIPQPATADALPAHVQYLLVGAGTASFAALRAIRSAQPVARVLLVGEESTPPYMRPPLSKEVWREPTLAAAAHHADTLTFRQWNGKQRTLLYEPLAFYAPPERLTSTDDAGTAALALGWRVSRLELGSHRAHLEAVDGSAHATITYDKCLIATGARAARVSALRDAGERSLALHTVEDVRRLAERLDRADTRHVAVVGGGFLGTELAAALAERMAGRAEVTQLYREDACLAHVLPAYLALEAARRVRATGARTLPRTEVAGVETAPDGRLRLRLASGATLDVDVAVEAVGVEPNTEVAAASRLELHPELGGVLVNAELAARSDHYAAGDVACFYDEVLGRRRVEHHDHAVVSGRLAGENMAGATPPKHYQHQSMLWSDLGPDFGYEAIGIVDSRLPTFSVFAAEEAGDASEAQARPLDRGVVFYLREKRVVGVLLWNLFNRMHVARQVLAVGHFEDLNEVAKLFALHRQHIDAESNAAVQ